MKNMMLLIFIAALFGCQQNSSTTSSKSTPRAGNSLTTAEQEAVLLAGTALSGQASGVLAPDGKTLELSISHSAFFHNEPDLVKLHASRAAWFFYKNRGSDNPPYDMVSVKAQLEDSTESVIPFTIQQLEEVQARYPTFEEVANKLITGDYQGLFGMFEPSVMSESSVSSLQNYCTSLDADLGKPKGFEFRGFSFEKNSGGQDVLNMAGLLKRTQHDSPLSISIDLAKKGMKESLYTIKFDY
ncbi:MAG: hypothetical protein GC192_08220 [Bacteroidetes bacterium]|nr:hypothetical protein [Bacteroidota bacterium]